MFGIFSCFTRNKMTDGRIEQMEPKITLEQFNLLTRLVSIGERLQQAGLPRDNMFKTIRMMQQSCHLGEKLPMCVTGPPTFTREQLILLTRQLSVYQSLQQTGLSEDSIFHIMPYMQQHITTNIDIDDSNCCQQNTMKRTATMILDRYFQMDTNPTENQREEIARVCNDELQKAGIVLQT
ncbi:uncharacterized protein LOC144884696 [Branchiostoma floridae x Branchiostoma japonicum]